MDAPKRRVWEPTLEYCQEYWGLGVILAVTCLISLGISYIVVDPQPASLQNNFSSISNATPFTISTTVTNIPAPYGDGPVINIRLTKKLGVEFLHICLPLFVLAVELYMLRRLLVDQKTRRVDMLTDQTQRKQDMSVEQASRKETDEALKAFRGSLGRENYLDHIVSAILTAEKEIVFTTSTMEASWHSDGQGKIFKAVKERFKRAKAESSISDSTTRQDQGESASKNKGQIQKPAFIHRGLVAKKPGTLPGVIELLCFTDVQLMMTPVMAMTRLRFFIQDKSRSIIGIAEGPSELARENPSTMSFALDSTMLATALHTHFESIWKASSDPWDYLAEFINESKKVDPEHAQQTLLKWLKADRADMKTIHQKLKENCPAYASLPSIPDDLFK